MNSLLTIDQIEVLQIPDGFADIDLHFARFICRLASDYNPLLFLAAALAGYAVRQNHICADLDIFSGTRFPEISGDDTPAVFIPGSDELVSVLGKYPDVVSDGSSHTPLVLDGSRLYLSKYFHFEEAIAAAVRPRTEIIKDYPPVLRETIRKISSRFRQSTESPDWQQVAVFMALHNNFSIITGAPGTGKTSVVAAILSLLLKNNPDLKIKICAPTGKAAARLRESVHDELRWLEIDEATQSAVLELEPSTIHRMLGVIHQTPFFRHNRMHPLNADVLVMDEASMVSLPLMVRLFESLQPHCRVILLGDKDQLSSVEAGAVFGDLCEMAAINCFSPEFIQAWGSDNLPRLQQPSPLTDCVVELQKSYRFDEIRGIGLMKTAISKIDDESSVDDFFSGITKTSDELLLKPLPRPGIFGSELVRFVETLTMEIDDKKIHFLDYRTEPDIRKAFRIMSEFRVLCAHRNGRTGVFFVNQFLISELLGKQNSSDIMPENLPVMITENDPLLALYNGDVGLARKDKNGIRRVWFPDLEKPGVFRSFIPAQLPAWEPAFAMTIHKSQGSGFQKMLMILPEKDTPVLTRELVYTGLTRAKKYCEIWADRLILLQAIRRRTIRVSGLKNRFQNIGEV